MLSAHGCQIRNITTSFNVLVYYSTAHNLSLKRLCPGPIREMRGGFFPFLILYIVEHSVVGPLKRGDSGCSRSGAGRVRSDVMLYKIRSPPTSHMWKSDNSLESIFCLEIPMVLKTLFLTAPRGARWEAGAPAQIWGLSVPVFEQRWRSPGSLPIFSRISFSVVFCHVFIVILLSPCLLCVFSSVLFSNLCYLVSIHQTFHMEFLEAK